MSFKNQIGMKVDIPGDLATDKKLFSETGGFILEVARGKLNELKKLFADQQVPVLVLGETNAEPRLRMNGVIDLQ